MKTARDDRGFPRATRPDRVSRASPAHRLLVALNDPALAPLLDAYEEWEVSAKLEELVETQVRPVIARVLSRCSAPIAAAADVDESDVQSLVVLRVLQKLQSARSSASDAIVKLDEYVARLTVNAVADVRRRTEPRWNRFKRRLRSIAANDERLASWDAPSGSVCGLAAWRERTDLAAAIDPAEALTIPELRSAGRPADALVALLRWAGAPLPLDLATSVLADHWGGSDAAEPPAATDLAALPEAYETREQLQIVWEEIRSLPPKQRIALLLNLRDSKGLNAVVLFPLTGVASFDEIAAAMEMTPEQLMEIWTKLPLADLEIAAILEVTRQQVINLRKSARARLQRRVLTRQRGQERA